MKVKDDAEWKKLRSEKPLVQAERTAEGKLLAVEGEARYPIPDDSEVVQQCPAEVMDLQQMQDWHACWVQYSSRLGLPLTPGDHAYDEGAIREQWIGSIVGGCLVLIGIFFVVRTYKRELALRGDVVSAAGQQFSVSDITSIDLRQWGSGFKGVAYFTVKGKKIKVDGMTYGGFSQKNGEPAEVFMKALLAQYKGDIIEYEQSEKDRPQA